MSPLGCVALSDIGRDVTANVQRLEAARLLIRSGARLGSADRGILYSPIAGGDLALVRLLIEIGASPLAPIEGVTPPEIAVSHNQKAIYDYLITRGGIPVDSASAAQIRLIAAAADGDMYVMDDALTAGAEINRIGPNGQTALIAAVNFGVYTPAAANGVDWLLDRGADPNVEGESQFKGVAGLPLHIFVAMTAAEFTGLPGRPDAKALAEHTLAHLLAAGAKVSGMDSIGRTPLHVAAEFDNVGAAKVLIQAGARVMARDERGRTPLDYAESSAMIRLLKANGATER
jgi:hypothetical protein